MPEIDPLIGKTLNNLKILAQIGEGGMAAVYKAHQISLDRIVAVKVLPMQFTFNEQLVKRFHKEAKAFARLNHPNIVQIYDVSECDGVHYFAMELVGTVDLKGYIKANGALGQAQATDLFTQIVKGVGEAHRNGIVHRDLKPNNILMTEDLICKVTDFGIAQVANTTMLTSIGAKIGTPRYMSPEQAMGETVDQRSDIYSMGILLYEMLASRPPFLARNEMALMHQQIYDQPAPISDFNDELSPGLVALLNRCLEKKPAERFQSTSEILDELERITTSADPQADEDHQIAGPVAGNGSHPQAKGPTMLTQNTSSLPSRVTNPRASLIQAYTSFGTGGAPASQHTAPPPPPPQSATPERPAIQDIQLANKRIIINRHLSKAADFVKRKAYAEAIEQYESILRIDESISDAHYYIGRFASLVGAASKILPHFRRAIEIAPGRYDQAYYVIGIAYDKSHKYELARQHFERSVHINPDNKHARIMVDMERHKIALSKQPASAEAHNGLGVCFQELGHNGHALAEYKKALSLNPRYAKAHYNYGVVQYNAGKLAEAHEAYKRATELEPNNALAHYGLGACFYKMGKTRAAKKSLSTSLALDTGNAAAKKMLNEI